MNPTLEVQNFDYASLDPETCMAVQQCTREIKEGLQDMAQAVWKVGQKLVEVRTYLRYGQFSAWLDAEFGWSRRTAYNYISVYESFGDWTRFARASIATTVLYLLANCSTPEEAREEALERATQGEFITHTTAKAIINKHKELSQPKAFKLGTVSVPAKLAEQESYIPAETDSRTETVKTEGHNLKTHEFEETILREEALANFQVCDFPKELPCKSAQDVENGWLFEEQAAEVKSQLEFRIINTIRIINVEAQDFEQLEDKIQTFDVSVAGYYIKVEGQPSLLINLFQQMQNNPEFAERVMQESRLIAERGVARHKYD